MKKVLQGLETALIIQRIELQAESFVSSDKKHKWARIANFLAVVPEPIEIKKFKKYLPVSERAKYILPAKVKVFDTNKLVTHQKQVIKRNLYHFIEKPSLAATAIMHKHYGEIEPIVVRCKTGLHVYDGNHRANTNHLKGKPHKAKYVDLRNVDEMIATYRKNKKK